MFLRVLAAIRPEGTSGDARSTYRIGTFRHRQERLRLVAGHESSSTIVASGGVLQALAKAASLRAVGGSFVLQ
ncbi:MAG TPA: hypothetical protein VNE58_07845 [Casimicrobiaceae bacterium]|nr:hypothetical protein [Casimicrobiaceae bacterium]